MNKKNMIKQKISKIKYIRILIFLHNLLYSEYANNDTVCISKKSKNPSHSGN